MPNTHTPGPWSAEVTHRDGKGYCVTIHGDKTPTSSVVVADMPLGFGYLPTNGHHASWDRQMANARLIAQAPRMLDALKFLCDLIDEGHEPLPGCDAVNEARAILRAVRGE